MSVQQARADYATAKRFAEEALALRRKAIQGPHLSISQGLNNLGMVHYRMKEDPRRGGPVQGEPRHQPAAVRRAASGDCRQPQ